MIKKYLTFALCILLCCLFSLNSYASTQMMIGIDTAGIYGSQDLKGTPILTMKLGEFLNVSPFEDTVMSIHGHNELITGYCNKNDLIYSNTLYFAEPGIMVQSNQYSLLVDTAKYEYLFKTNGLEFKKDSSSPMLIQQATYFKLKNLALALDALGYKTVVTRAYLYTDENGTQSYAAGCRLDFEIYAGSIKISIPSAEYDEDTDSFVYSEIEQVFIDNEFVRIGSSHTFEDAQVESYFAYEVDFKSLPYVIMD